MWAPATAAAQGPVVAAAAGVEMQVGVAAPVRAEVPGAQAEQAAALEATGTPRAG
jgi:hypothetical protein